MTDDAAPSPEELFRRAQARERQRDVPGALSELDRLLELLPDHREALLERGRLLLIREERQRALKDLTRLLGLDGENIRGYFYRALAQAPVDLPSALLDYERAARTEPRDGVGFYFRGLAKESLNRASESRADFERALQLIPEGDPHRAAIQEKAAVRLSPPLASRIRSAPVTFFLIGINVVVMLCFPRLWGNPTVDDLLRAGALERYAVWSGEFWRLFTSMFLHIGLMHLFWNSYGAVGWCAPVEKEIGSWRFAACYLLTGLGASATSVLAHHVTAAGSSGALFGIQGVFLYSFRHRLGSWERFFADRIVRKVLWSTGIWFLFGMTILPMDNYAHLGGLVFGLLLGWMFLRAPGWSRGRRLAARVAGLGAVLLVCVLAALPVGPGSGLYRGYLDHLAGLEALEKGDLVRAEARLASALEAGYRDPAAVLGYAAVFYRREEFARSADLYEEVVRLDPKLPDGYFGRGSSALGLHHPEKALEDYLKAVEVAPATWGKRAEAQKMVDDLRAYLKR